MSSMPGGPERIPLARWTGREAIETWLLEQFKRPDAELDLAAMALALGALEHPAVPLERYARHLDALIADAGARHGEEMPLAARVRAINLSLFERHGYGGDAETYDNLDNANLIRVIDRRKGLPIALAILYLHIARGNGWSAEGINFPGHFVLRLEDRGSAVIIDPFAAGAACDADYLERLLRSTQGTGSALEQQHLAPASNRDMLLRLQNNIKTRQVQRGEFAAALAAVERMALIVPDHPGIWLEAAALHGEIGQLQRGLLCLDAVRRLDPQGALAQQTDALAKALRTKLN
jgi:regulator of sirC expression with transglutaminase-like and TPR domain